MKTTHTIGLVAWLLTAVVAASPLAVHAAYTMHGHTFATASELATYVEQYNRVYNELHGISNTSTLKTSTVTTTKTVSGVVKSKSLEVTTSKVTEIDMYNVRLAGTVYFKGSKAVRTWFEYGPNPKSLYYRSRAEVLEREGSSRKFDIRVTELNHNTTYYYRAVGVNENGVQSYGAIKSVKTKVDPWSDEALVRAYTGWATSVDDDHAYMWASVWLRDAQYAKVWFEYGDEEDDLDKRTSAVYLTPASNSTYFKLVPKLRDETTYYYRVMAEDPTGARSYGEIFSFTTRYDIVDEAPYVDTYGPEDVNGYSASASALLDINDYDDGTAFMVYGEDGDRVAEVATKYTSYKSIKESGDDLQKLLVDDDLNGVIYTKQNLLYLDPNTTYYVTFGIAHENAEGDDVITMGAIQAFTTQDVL